MHVPLTQPTAAGIDVSTFNTPTVNPESSGKQLEGMFASILIKTMRESIGGEGLFPGDSSDVLGALFDQHMGEQMTKGQGMGLASFLDANIDTSEIDFSGSSEVT